MKKKLINMLTAGNDRTRLMQKNIVASFALKACTGVISLILVPLTLACLGDYENGVWMTISSSLLWIEMLDIGLGNGLRNKLSEYVANDDWENARKAVASTLVMLCCIVIPVMVLLVGGVCITDVYALLNVSREITGNLTEVVVIAIVLFCSTFIMKFIGNVYLGLQLPAVSNLLTTGGHPIILLGTYYMYSNGIHSLMGIAMLNLGVPLVMYLIAYPYTFYYKYPRLRPSLRSFDKRITKEITNLGVLFFVNQVASSVVFLSSNIIISNWYSPADVTPYQIAYKYFSILFLVFIIMVSPNWTATTDAWVKGDTAWIRNTARKVNKLLAGFFIVEVGMVVFAEPIYSIWIGNEVRISPMLTVSMALYMFIMMSSLAYCYFLNGMGKLRLQLIGTVIGMVMYVVAIYVLDEYLNDVTAISFGISIGLMPNMILNYVQYNKIMNGKAKGIWNK